MATYNDSNTRRSFMKFDLTQPCADASPGGPPAGRTELDQRGAPVGVDGRLVGLVRDLPGINYDGQVIEPLGNTAVWDEATLNGEHAERLPDPQRVSHNFSAGARTRWCRTRRPSCSAR